MSLIMTSGYVYRMVVMAGFVGAFVCPVEAEDAVADDLESEQDHGVLVEDKVKWEAEP